METPYSPIHAPSPRRESTWSQMILVALAIGTARRSPIAPQIQAQTSVTRSAEDKDHHLGARPRDKFYTHLRVCWRARGWPSDKVHTAFAVALSVSCEGT